MDTKEAGGKAAAAKLTPKQRSKRARKAVRAREQKRELLRGYHPSAD
jgi:hypothetical protein